MSKKYLVFIAAFVIFLIAKFLGGTWLISGFLALSLIILYFLGESKKALWFNLIGGLILMIDAILLILLMVPTKAYNINTAEFYAKKQNYMKIYIKDPPEKLKSMAILIRRKQNGQTKRSMIKLSDYKKNTKIPIFPKDKIYFVGLKTNKSYAAIYLWDSTILRITPGTRLRLAKITKNLENLANSQTQIQLESGNIWFHVIKLIKGSSNMQIQTSTGQMLIIRGTAGLVSKENPNSDKTYAIDYSHFIEAKNPKQSAILKPGEGAIITNKQIKIVKQIEAILQKAGLNPKILDQFPMLDKQDLKNYKKELINYIKTKLGDNLIIQIETLKLKIFSIGDKNYKQYLENLETYQYLLGQTNQITQELLNNPNIAFIASNLQKQEAKIAYLYNQLKQNIQNSDLYKTYIINLGIKGKIKDLSNKTLEKIIQAKQYLNNWKFGN